MNLPVISVVVPTYNRVKYLNRALDSVAAQAFEDWECIVCDDASSDETREVTSARALSDPRFRLVPCERYGLPAGPRNCGVRQARGEWIAFLDDDDVWHPVKLARQIAVARASSCDAVSVGSSHYSESEPPKFGEPTVTRSVVPIGLVGLLLRREPYPCTSATMVKREAILRVSGFAESPAYRAVEDFDLWCRVLAIPGFRWLVDGSGALVAYRDRGSDSISSWHKVLDPDVIRQQWAQIECVTRSVAGTTSLARIDRAAIMAALLGRADDCAARCRKVGWRRAALSAYSVAVLCAVYLGRPREAALRVRRAFRRSLEVCVASRPGIPVTVPELARRSLVQSLAIVAGRKTDSQPYRATPRARGPFNWAGEKRACQACTTAEPFHSSK